MNGKEINIKKWKPNIHFKLGNKKSPQPFTMCLVASRNSGKSYFIKHIYQSFLEGRYDFVIVFSKTLSTGFYNYVKSRLKFEKFNEETISGLIRKNKDYKKKYGKYLDILVIFDDMINSKTKHSESISDIFTLGRHHNISCIYATQYLKDLNPRWRSNTTLLVVLKCMSDSLDHLIEHYLLCIVNKYEIQYPRRFLYNLIAQVCFSKNYQYRALVIDYEINSLDIEDKIYFYKAP